MKNLGEGIPESVVREELVALNIHVKGVMQLRSGRRDQVPAKDRTLTPHFIVSVAASTPKCRPRDDQRPPIPVGIQNEIRLKNWLRRRWHVSRDPALKAEVNRLQRSVTRRLNEWRNDKWSATFESLDPEDQSLWRMTKRVMRVPTPSTPWLPRGESLSQILRKPKPLPTIWRLSFSR